MGRPKIIVRCPKCNRKQGYLPTKVYYTWSGRAILSHKKKKCIFCEKHFWIHKDIKNTNIVEYNAPVRTK